MKTAIVDTQTRGHHLEQMYSLCLELQQRKLNDKFDVYCDAKLYDYIEKNNLQSVDDSNQINIKTGILHEIRLEWRWLKITRKATSNIKKLSEYDRLIILYMKAYLPALFVYSIFSKISFSFSTILFQSPIREKNGWKTRFTDFMLKYILKNEPDCQIFLMNNPEDVRLLNKKYSTDAFGTIADPIPSFYYNGIENHSHHSNQTTFTLIGAIDERKGIFDFLNAIEHSKSENHFLIAGRVESSISQDVQQKIVYLNKQGFNVELRNKLLPNKEFAKTILESDIIVMPYSSHEGASSGILGHAAFAGKPVIGPAPGLVADLINKYTLGVTVKPKNIENFSNYLSDPSKIYQQVDKTQMQKYVEMNTHEEFFLKLIRQSS